MKNTFFINPLTAIADTKNNSWPNFVSTMGQLFFLILVLCFVVFIIYMFARLLGKFRMGIGNSNIKIIEYKNIGLQNHIMIVNIKERYFLISSSKERVNFLAELNKEDIDINDETEKKDTNFKKIFDTYLKKKDRTE